MVGIKNNFSTEGESMKKMIATAMMLTSIATMASPLQAFKGVWKNMDSATRSITKLKIRVVQSDDIRIRTFGACSPHDCAWGMEQGVAFGPSVSANLMHNTRSVMTTYDQGFSKKIIMMNLKNPTHMTVKVYTQFLDGSGRANYMTKLNFVKQQNNNPNPGFIHFSSVGSKVVHKIVFLPYEFNLNSYGTVKAIRISAADAKLNIQSAMITYANGTHRSLDNLLGYINEGETKQMVFPAGHIQKVTFTASSPNPIGSRGTLMVMAGMPN